MTLDLRVTDWMLGEVTLTRAATGEVFTKPALGLAGFNPHAPLIPLSYRLVYQQIVDTLEPMLRGAAGAPVDVHLAAFGFRNRVTFTIQVR